MADIFISYSKPDRDKVVMLLLSGDKDVRAPEWPRSGSPTG